MSTWVGDEDAEAVAYRTKEKFGLGRVEREANERTVQLALPRTTITVRRIMIAIQFITIVIAFWDLSKMGGIRRPLFFQDSFCEGSRFIQ